MSLQHLISHSTLKSFSCCICIVLWKKIMICNTYIIFMVLGFFPLHISTWNADSNKTTFYDCGGMCLQTWNKTFLMCIKYNSSSNYISFLFIDLFIRYLSWLQLKVAKIHSTSSFLYFFHNKNHVSWLVGLTGPELTISWFLGYHLNYYNKLPFFS